MQNPWWGRSRSSDEVVEKAIANKAVEARAFGISGEQAIVNIGGNIEVPVDDAGSEFQIEDRCFGVIAHAGQYRGFDGDGRAFGGIHSVCPSVSTLLLRLGKCPPRPQTSRGYERLRVRRGSLRYAA